MEFEMEPMIVLELSGDEEVSDDGDGDGTPIDGFRDSSSPIILATYYYLVSATGKRIYPLTDDESSKACPILIMREKEDVVLADLKWMRMIIPEMALV